MHISDSHIGASQIEGPDAPDHLTFALTEASDVIQPWFIVNSGDLVDGSKLDIPAFGQDQAEWDLYKQIYTDAAVTPAYYFDLPGNHDGYDDMGLTFYLANSLQGQTNNALFTSWLVSTPIGDYYFFGLNSVGNGSGPFLEKPKFTMDELDALDSGLKDNTSAELAFVFAHHDPPAPENSDKLIDILKVHDVGYYLHGHKHKHTEYSTAGDTIVVNQVDTLGKGKVDNIAVGVIDHNGFSYHATNFQDPWPFVVITAPMSHVLRDSDKAHPYAYEVCKDRKDNPVRALVFAKEATTSVTVKIGDGSINMMTLAPGSTALWEADVDTTELDAGVHDVIVSATVGESKREHIIATSFVDGPCDELPDSGYPMGGSGGAGGAGGQSSGGAGPAGGAGAVGGGGFGGGEVVAPPAADVDSGCGCRQAGVRARGDLGNAAALGLLGLAVVGLRRRRRWLAHSS